MGSTDSRNSEDNIYDVLRTDILNLKLRPGMIFSIRDMHMKSVRRLSNMRKRSFRHHFYTA
jgi:hypothetical protein